VRLLLGAALLDGRNGIASKVPPALQRTDNRVADDDELEDVDDVLKHRGLSIEGGLIIELVFYAKKLEPGLGALAWTATV